MGRIVVLAADPHIGQAVEEELHRNAGNGRSQIRIVAPALARSRFEHAAGAVDEGIHEAEERLEESEADLEEKLQEGAQVEGSLGDSDPILALEDALREGPADEIVIVTHADETKARWLEPDAFERAKERFSVPVVHFTAVEEGGRVRVTEAGRSSGADPSTTGELEPVAENLPRFSPRDLAGIVVAVVGTIVLVVIASSSGHRFSAEGGITFNNLSGPAARVLIAGAAGLLNLAHVVGLVLFQSVGYHGPAEKLFSNLSLWGTLIAIPVALIIG